MRKIEKEMCNAVKAQRNFCVSNTQVICSRANNGGTKVKVYLHGNLIYEEYENLDGAYERYFTLAGWDTPTTRNRLRALGVGVRHINKRPVYNGQVIDKNKWYEVK